uniref:GNAT family N-acetyltransferase n=1 Tax=Dongshaea marina TaxID=2047966 RepID=UPI0038994F5B
MISVPLDKSKHDRRRFDCGVPALNSYLRVMASQQAVKDNSRTFVIEDPQREEWIIGYYSLTMIPVDLGVLPEKLQKKHQSARSGGLIARLAVDRRYTGNGYGEWLLIDSLHKLLQASESVGFPVVVVDAKEGAADFYRKFGFQSFADTPNKLFMTIADIRASLG